MALGGFPEAINAIKIIPYDDGLLPTAVQALVTHVSEDAGGYVVLLAAKQAAL